MPLPGSAKMTANWLQKSAMIDASSSRSVTGAAVETGIHLAADERNQALKTSRAQMVPMTHWGSEGAIWMCGLHPLNLLAKLHTVCVYSNGVTCACTWDKYGDIWMTFAHRSGWCTCHKRAAGAVQAVSSTPPRHRPQQTITWVAKSFWDKPIWGAGPSSRWYLYLGMLPKCTRLWQAPQCVATKASKQNDSQICQICQGAPVGILNVFEVGYDGILLNDSE